MHEKMKINLLIDKLLVNSEVSNKAIQFSNNIIKKGGDYPDRKG